MSTFFPVAEEKPANFMGQFSGFIVGQVSVLDFLSLTSSSLNMFLTLAKASFDMSTFFPVAEEKPTNFIGPFSVSKV